MIKTLRGTTNVRIRFEVNVVNIPQRMDPVTWEIIIEPEFEVQIFNNFKFGE